MVRRAELDDVLLVGHDWGGALACDWAARHPDRVQGLAVFETILRPMTWRDFPGAARDRIESLRNPGSGETKVLDENFFIERALRVTSLQPLSEQAWAVYAAPYPTPASRRALLAWPRQFPIEGDPADVHARVVAYDDWLAASAGVPKLLLTFAGPPDLLIIGADEVAWCREHIADLEVAECGPAGHLATEDRPTEIAAAIETWATRHGLGGA